MRNPSKKLHPAHSNHRHTTRLGEMERTGFSDMAADASAEDSLTGAAVSSNHKAHVKLRMVPTLNIHECPTFSLPCNK